MKGIVLVDMSTSMIRDDSRLEILRTVLEDIIYYSKDVELEVIGYRTVSVYDDTPQYREFGRLEDAVLGSFSARSDFGGNSPLGDALLHVSERMSSDKEHGYALIVLTSNAGNRTNLHMDFYRDLYRDNPVLLESRRIVVTIGCPDEVSDRLAPLSDTGSSAFRSIDRIDWERVFF